jgi:hypothetical protein
VWAKTSTRHLPAVFFLLSAFGLFAVDTAFAVAKGSGPGSSS